MSLRRVKRESYDDGAEEERAEDDQDDPGCQDALVLPRPAEVVCAEAEAVVAALIGGVVFLEAICQR